MADWAGLNHDLLIEIVERVTSMEGYEYFGGVCTSWRAAARKGHLKKLTCFGAPSLLFAEKEESGQLEREISSIASGIKKTRSIFLPEASKQFCVSCKDWLLVTSLDEIDASLLHPLTRVQIPLPKFTTLSTYTECCYRCEDEEEEDEKICANFIGKAVLSANPTTTSDFIVMVICGSKGDLAFWKSGDTCWTSIDYQGKNQCCDIMYCNSKLYGSDLLGNIITCDIHGPNPTQVVQVFQADFPKNIFGAMLYLLELSEDKFLVVFRNHEFPIENSFSYHTSEFKIVEVNIKDGTWLEIKELGNKALFLGNNSSFSVECSEFNKCKPNCIYFSDDYEEGYSLDNSGGGKDMGIYHLSDKRFQPLFDDIALSKITPPTWIGSSFS